MINYTKTYKVKFRYPILIHTKLLKYPSKQDEKYIVKYIFSNITPFSHHSAVYTRTFDFNILEECFVLGLFNQLSVLFTLH